MKSECCEEVEQRWGGGDMEVGLGGCEDFVSE